MESDRLAAFELMMGSTPRIWIAGIVAYGISQTLNVTVFSWLKGHEGTGLLWLRTAVAGVASQAVDTLLFVNIAFLGVFPVRELLPRPAGRQDPAGLVVAATARLRLRAAGAPAGRVATGRRCRGLTE